MSPRLFVYGTLKPGHSRWPILEPHLEPGAPVVDDQVEGRLWATPWGWPALTEGSETVRGVVVELCTDRADGALADLDAVEGVGAGLFEREEIVTHAGVTCWVYVWPSGSQADEAPWLGYRFAMATPEEIESLEASLSDWMGPTNASTLLQLLRSRPRSFDPEKNPLVAVGLITDLHDAMVEHGDHELADGVLELARYPAKYWVPSCSALS